MGLDSKSVDHHVFAIVDFFMDRLLSADGFRRNMCITDHGAVREMLVVEMKPGFRIFLYFIRVQFLTILLVVIVIQPIYLYHI